jgi:L-2-amino-thiazoline-4-carboxylic acid hydrolase
MPNTHDVAVTHLQRRKIEGRVLIRFIETLRERVGEDATREVVDETIRKLAAKDGARWAQTYGRSTDSLRRVAEEVWAGGGSLDVEIVRQADDHLDFNVTRCGYAEFYKELGLADIGYRLHCNRDHAMWWVSTANLSCTVARRSWKARAAATSGFARKIEGAPLPNRSPVDIPSAATGNPPTEHAEQGDSWID